MKVFYFLFTLFIFTNTLAKTAEEKGHEVAEMMAEENRGFVGETSTMELVLIDAHGTKVIRKMDGLTKEVEGDGDKSISIFKSPKDVKGTKMLTHTHKTKDDDQWLYLPSLRRVKRISSSNKSASFMGSEFSYEDLGSQEIEKYNHKLLDESELEKEPIWILERTPKKKSGYSKQVVYVSKKLKSALQVDYYDRRGDILKQAYFKDYKVFDVKGKKLNRPSQIHMKNIQTKKESIFTWKSRKLGVSHSNNKFSKRGLK